MSNPVLYTLKTKDTVYPVAGKTGKHRELIFLPFVILIFNFFFNAVSAQAPVDPSSIIGKVVCGYQGWFNCEGDGANRGWVHWVKSKGIPSPANIKVDLWPDVSELGADERFDTAFHHVDGTPAQVFSSFLKNLARCERTWLVSGSFSIPAHRL